MKQRRDSNFFLSGVNMEHAVKAGSHDRLEVKQNDLRLEL